jgi:hypothetical protein
MAGGAGRTRAGRQILLVLAASVLAVAGALAPDRAPIARAASDGLEVTTATTYTVVPVRHVVQVTLVLTARNNKPNVTAGGIVTKYFYEGARLAIQSEARNVRATEGGFRLTATTRAADGYQILEVRFRASLFFQQSTTVQLAFDLPGGAPRSLSDIRVGTAFATFVAWAFGDSGSVRVVVPAGFDAAVTGSDVAKTTSNGASVFRASAIADVGNWYLVVNADRKSALTNDRVDLTGGEHIVVRAWPEDTTWRKRVRDLLTRGLPKLVEEIGLPWPLAGDLPVVEVHTPLLEGYAGQYVPAEQRIEISEDLDDHTIIHEATHAWFNGALFAGRWIGEGLADTFAARTLDGLGIGDRTPGAVSPTDPAAVRLVDWVHPGRITDAPTEAREQFGYDASWTVVSAIVTDVGLDGMQRVFGAAQAHQIAYVGALAPETVSGGNDWRRLLDLLDELGHSARSDELFRTWIVNDAQAATLDQRATARTAYADLVDVGGGWKPPFYVRGPMSDWDFATATTRIAEARTFLDRKLEIEAGAGLLQLPVSPDLKIAYETADDSFRLANQLADQEDASLRALVTATQAVDAPRAPFVALGLIGTTPELALAAARIAFTNGSPFAADQASALTALIDGAVEVGRGRLMAAIVVVVAVVVLLVIAVLLVRRRGRRRERERMAGGAPAVLAAAAGSSFAGGAGEPPYATLADQSARPLDPDGAAAGSAPPEPVAADHTSVTADAGDAPDANDATEPPPAARGDAS